MNINISNHSERLSQKQKDAKDKQWYKDKIDKQHNIAFSQNSGFNGNSRIKNMQINFDLFNNKLNMKDLMYVAKPFGEAAGELPATMANRDIVSGKLKVLIGMEMKRAFMWKAIAINPDATTRKEQAEFGKMKEYVVNSIMSPIKKNIEMQKQQELQGQELTEDQKAQIQAQIDEELQAMTPEEVRKYMQRNHQDPAEALAHQLLEYLIKKERLPEKFNQGWKNSLIAGPDLFWVGIVRDEPAVRVPNPMRFDHDRSVDSDRIQDGSWASAEYYMSLSQIAAMFDLDDNEYKSLESTGVYGDAAYLSDSDFTFREDGSDTQNKYRVVHHEWVSQREIGFLTYLDEDGQEQMRLVYEGYKLNEDAGDVSLEWAWFPEKHHGYKIGKDIYKKMEPVPGQDYDIDNLYDCPLSYIGQYHDATNSAPTSPMDRVKYYQYYYNVILYRIELLMASDQGKLLLMNINAVPRSAGIDLGKFQYYAAATKTLWVNPSEEGNRNSQDVTTLAKEIDMSLASDIQKYIMLAEYIEERCGNSIGVSKAMEGQIGPNDAVTNTKQNLLQSSHILEPYFEMHNNVKRDVLQQLLNVAKVAYTIKKPKKLSYVLDDMSVKMLDIDQDLLANSTYGLFVSNSSEGHEVKQNIENLSQAAMQNQAIAMSAIVKVMSAKGVQEAAEILEVAEQTKLINDQAMEKQRQQSEGAMAKRQQEHEQMQWQHEADMIILKERENRETQLQKQAMLSIGFDPNKDQDGDGEPDVLEVYKHGLDTEIKMRQQALAEKKFEYDKEHNSEKIKLEKEKIQVSKVKKK